MKRWYTLPMVIATFLALIIVLFGGGSFGKRTENLLLDLRFQIKNYLLPPVVPDNIVIVSVDEQSLAEFGRWPWSRTLQASLIEKVLEGSPKVLGIDILYTEPETPQADGALRKVLSRGPVVLAMGLDVSGMATREALQASGPVEDILWDHAVMKIKHYSLLRPPEAKRVLLPRTVLSANVVLGHVYSIPDRDGKTRWEYLYVKYKEDIYPCLALQTVRLVEGLSMDQIVVYAGTEVRIGRHRIPTDPYGRMLINYLGREGTFRYISASDVLKGRVPLSVFKDKIVLLGTSAIATYDIKATAFSANMPGVEKNATVIENILNDRYVTKAGILVDLLVVLLMGLLMAVVLPRFKAIWSVAVGLAIILVYLTANVLVFTYMGLWVNLSVVSGQMVLIFLYNLSYKYFMEERQSRYLKKLFSSYVSERIVREIINNPEMASLGGRRRDVTVLFLDIVGFTSLSEQQEPEKVVTMLNDFFKEMVEIILKYDGTLDKFVGDEIMAFWGAPVEQLDHPVLAVRCAIEMLEKIDSLNKTATEADRKKIQVGIGINSGEALVGNIGVEHKKMDYTVIGDHVNLAARLEALTRQYHVPLIISEYTYRRLPDTMKSGFTKLGSVRVKGRTTEVVIYGFSPLSHRAGPSA